MTSRTVCFAVLASSLLACSAPAADRRVEEARPTDGDGEAAAQTASAAPSGGAPDLVIAPNEAPPDVVLPPPPSAEPTASSTARVPSAAEDKPALVGPNAAQLVAPMVFSARFETTAGDFDIECLRSWSAKGADRIFNLVRMGWFDGVAFFRVIRDPSPFVAQFGIHPDPAVNEQWREAKLPIEPVKQKNLRGTITFAMAGSADTRTTQLFINLADNERLDAMGFAPVCRVKGTGMKVVDAFFAGYGGKPSNDQPRIMKEGRAFLEKEYPKLDVIRRARLTER